MIGIETHPRYGDVSERFGIPFVEALPPTPIFSEKLVEILIADQLLFAGKLEERLQRDRVFTLPVEVLKSPAINDDTTKDPLQSSRSRTIVPFPNRVILNDDKPLLESTRVFALVAPFEE